MPKTVSRRSFLTAMISTGIALQIPGETLGMFSNKASKTKIGIITDLHQDIMHDGQERLEAFLTHMKKVKPHALLQMGDFAYPGDKNKTVINLFNNAHPSPMHVIGNHDTDAGYTKQQCLDYWGMPARFYAKNIHGVCFIILDGNDKDSPNHKGGYASYINKEQTDWLQQQLTDAIDPVVIISHQPLAGDGAVDNAVELQKILSEHSKKILLAINGHTHIDSHLVIDKVNYVHTNSASYFWMGDKFKHKSYSDEVHKEHPWIEYTCPYNDALFAVLTIDPLSGVIKIEGSKSTWKGSSPKELSYFNQNTSASEKEIIPSISSRNIKGKKS